MISFLKKNSLYILALTSGLLLSLPFLDIGLEWVIWFALVPLLFVVLEENNYKLLIKRAALAGVVFFGISLYWLYFVTLLGLSLVILYLSLYFVLFAVTLKLLYKKRIISSLSQIFIIPSVWVVIEYLRGHLFSGFGWVSLGYSQYRNLSFIQIADILGVYGVSFLIVLVNVTIKEVILNLKYIILFDKDKLKKIAFLVCAAILAVILVYAYGDIKLSRPLEGKEIKLSVIQGNIPQSQKWEPFYRDLILQKYKKITHMASFDEPDLIVWPETSLPGYLNEYELFKEVTQLAIDVKLPLLVGAARIDDESDGCYNSAVLIAKDGYILDIYDKIHPVPFGEYIPFPFIFGFLRGKVDIADFLKGDNYTIFKVKDKSFGVLICFEDIFSDLVRDFVKNGADFMVNMTNDAWFMRSPEPYQHLQASVFRAVENRVNLVRAANTGISCFIDPYGRITEKVSYRDNDIFIEGYKSQVIQIKKIKTFYSQFGDIFILISLAIIVIGFIRLRAIFY